MNEVWCGNNFNCGIKNRVEEVCKKTCYYHRRVKRLELNDEMFECLIPQGYKTLIIKFYGKTGLEKLKDKNLKKLTIEYED